MPQLSLYIDQETLEKIERAAKNQKTSLSKWVVARLRDSIGSAWPAEYKSLFGALQDDSFHVERPAGFEHDSLREPL
jgi:hypothetical protein